MKAISLSVRYWTSPEEGEDQNPRKFSKILESSRKFSTASAGIPSMMVYADSAIGRDVQPLFIPDIAQQWMCHVCVAVRIGRLGKCIAERFADRYVDAIGLVAVIDPVDADAIDPPALLSIMDSAITTGRWCTVPGLPSGELTMTVGTDMRTYDVAGLHIPRHISFVSRASTLKTGDMIILKDTAITSPLETNTWVRASLTGTVEQAEALRIKVK